VRLFSSRAVILGVAVGLFGCSGPDSAGGSGPGGSAGGSTYGASGGAATGGSSLVGNTGGNSSVVATGGAATVGNGVGGLPATGGSNAATGGVFANTGGNGATTGGSPATGGKSGGGAAATGGASATGGNSGGGVTATGGASANGGKSGGGVAATGGASATGGNSGGAAATGGKSGGGASATGGSSANAGGTAGGSISSSSTETTPGSGCTPPAAYGNLFISVSGHTQAETDAKITAGWSQLFNPSGSNTIYYNGPGADESYVEDIGNGDVRSEGMSYGMMIAVQLDKHTEFDRLWTWVKNHMAQGTGQICWQNHTDGSKMSGGGAPDGEEYFATALIFASKRWGNTGKYNYANEAQWILNLLRTTYFNSSAHIVQFIAGSGNTDGSYILPAFYQTWACFDTANASYWNSAITAGRTFFHNAIDANGVIGDQSSFTGQTTKAAGPDTIRCVANIMMDHNYFNVDAWQSQTYAPLYGPYVTSHPQNSTAATSANGLLGFGLPVATGKPFVDKVWSLAIPTGTWRYYDGCWYMMSLLHMSGAFKLWY
jgi:oligosaccharide reducing-end xylanase